VECAASRSRISSWNVILVAYRRVNAAPAYRYRQT
jgi:hypothetical protein